MLRVIAALLLLGGIALADEAHDEATRLLQTRCAPCHGPQGKGDGPAAAGLNPHPRNWTDPVWQKAVTDDQIEKAIVQGGLAVGKSPIMPPNPDLASRPDVVRALREAIRGLAAK